MKKRVENKESKKEYQRKWYYNHRKEQLARVSARNILVREANRAQVKDYLSSHPCVDCGEPDIEVLDFDHVRGVKFKDVSALVYTAYSLRTIIREIEKCDIRCANCHRRKNRKTLWAAS